MLTVKERGQGTYDQKYLLSSFWNKFWLSQCGDQVMRLCHASSYNHNVLTENKKSWLEQYICENLVSRN